MKTTIDLPDELYRRVKVSAAVQGVSLKQLFIEALEAALPDNPARDAPWKKLAGKSSDLVDKDLRDMDFGAYELRVVPEDH